VRIAVPSPQHSQEAVFVLRRLHVKQWDADTQEALPSGFTLRPDEPGLSVFLESVKSPRQVLEKYLEDQREKFKDDPPKLENKLNSNGRTVEEMVDRHHWRVARVPTSSFQQTVFQIGEANEDGYLQIYGTPEDFQKYSTNIAREAILCTAEECKR
jgi:hypothetical protein